MAFDPVKDLGALVDEAGLAWSVIPGSKHLKFLVEGVQVCVVSRGKNAENASDRGHMNNRAAVKRACDQLSIQKRANKAGLILPGTRLRGQR